MIVPQETQNEIIIKALADGAKVNLTANGTSMFPYIWPNDILTVEKQRAYNIDDIVVFAVPERNSFIAHRLVKTDGAIFTTWGDSCLTPDKPFGVGSVMGIVTRVQGKVLIYNANGRLWRLYGKTIRLISPLSHFVCHLLVCVGRWAHRVFNYL